MNIKGLAPSAGLVALCLLAGCGSGKPDASAELPATATAPAVSAPQAVPVATAEPEVAPVYADFVGDATAGRRLFIQCQACHSLKPDDNRVGPSLHGVIGAHAGHLSDYRYSRANQNSGIIWSEEILFDYLKNPRAMVPGTTMGFAGIADPQKRADLIAYLKANGGAG